MIDWIFIFIIALLNLGFFPLFLLTKFYLIFPEGSMIRINGEFMPTFLKEIHE